MSKNDDNSLDIDLALMRLVIFLMICIVGYFAVNIIAGAEKIEGTHTLSTEIILKGVTKEDITLGVVPLYGDEIPKNYTKVGIADLAIREGATDTPKINLVYDYVGVPNGLNWRVFGYRTDIGDVEMVIQRGGKQSIILMSKFKSNNTSKYKNMSIDEDNDAYFIKLAEDNLKDKTEYSSNYDIVVAINKEQSYIEVPKNYLN